MSSDDKEVTFENPYTLSSVNQTKAPEGADGNNWYRYVVERDSNTIVGCMRGTFQQVTTYAEEFVENLNIRSHSSKRYSQWSTTHQKRPANPK